MQSSSIKQLLLKKRFGPFFCTQFFGAFNDNLFKQALLTLAAFGLTAVADPATFNNIAAGAFILPFFLFSAIAGQLSDKFDKAKMIRLIKIWEIVLMVLAAIGFYLQSMQFLVALLFLMGTQSAFFGPIKFGILPQHMHSSELVRANALVEAGTFIAILLGSMCGVLLVGAGVSYAWLIGTTVILIALAGYLASLCIPAAPSYEPTLKINWNIFSETIELVKLARKKNSVYLSILGNAWFWFFGSVLLVQLPIYCRDFLHGGPQVVALLLTEFSVSMAIGSILCDKLSGKHVEIGLVPIGALGMTIFGVGLYVCLPDVSSTDALLSAAQVLQDPRYWPVLGAIFGIGISGGLYIVPLYALIQQRSDPNAVSRVIAANNVFNAAFMVLSAVFSVILLSMGVTVPELFIATGVLNLLVTLFIFLEVPEFILRLISWVFVHVIWRMETKNESQIPSRGPAVLVCNHVSFADAIILLGCSPRPVRFVMYHKIFADPIFKWVFMMAKAIPIAPRHENEALMESAFEEVSKALKNNELVCIFPEGKITADGEINEFKAGIERILQQDPVPVVPMALRGMWGSFFSRAAGSAMALRMLPGKLWQPIELNIGGLIQSPIDLTAVELQKQVSDLRGDWK